MQDGALEIHDVVEVSNTLTSRGLAVDNYGGNEVFSVDVHGAVTANEVEITGEVNLDSYGELTIAGNISPLDHWRLTSTDTYFAILMMGRTTTVQE